MMIFTHLSPATIAVRTQIVFGDTQGILEHAPPLEGHEDVRTFHTNYIHIDPPLIWVLGGGPSKRHCSVPQPRLLLEHTAHGHLFHMYSCPPTHNTTGDSL